MDVQYWNKTTTKKKKKGKCIEKYFAFTFLDLVKQLYSDEVLHLINLFRKIEYPL